MKFGLIGKTLSYSYSKNIHGRLGSEYSLCEVSEERFADFIKTCDLDGYNVTIPYKAAVIDYCSYLDPVAKSLESVNTVAVKNGVRYGYNTDYYGFKYTVLQSGVCVRGKTCLVFGSGATGRTVKRVLEDLGGTAVTVGRTSEVNYGNVYGLYGGVAEILVNATPVGTYPNTEQSVVDVTAFSSVKAVFDVTYNPLNTKLLYEARRGFDDSVVTENGLKMLVYQAVCANKIFTAATQPVNFSEFDFSSIDVAAQDALSFIKRKVLNVTLIGMAGSGKTSIGKLLADALGKKFIDTDDEVFKLTGSTPEELIVSGKIKEFRKAESEVLKRVCKENNQVISTGGGAVCEEENGFFIKENSFTVFLQRDLDKLDLTGRPLSKDIASAEKLFNERKNLYKALSDYTAYNGVSAEATGKEILQAYEDFSS